jgi:uncharacterized coiled-coil protein SlyX
MTAADERMADLERRVLALERLRPAAERLSREVDALYARIKRLESQRAETLHVAIVEGEAP